MLTIFDSIGAKMFHWSATCEIFPSVQLRRGFWFEILYYRLRRITKKNNSQFWLSSPGRQTSIPNLHPTLYLELEFERFPGLFSSGFVQ